MIRTVGLLAGFAVLSACGGDRGGSNASGAGAPSSAITYVPVTPGARPILAGEDGVAVAQGAVPVLADGAQVEMVVAAAAPAPRSPAQGAAAFATGPIFDACRSAGRSGATRDRCGCVQWVADGELTPQQQRRGARYFSDQHGLQEVRQSDDRENSEFWQAWSRFGTRAGDLCRGA